MYTNVMMDTTSIPYYSYWNCAYTILDSWKGHQTFIFSKAIFTLIVIMFCKIHHPWNMFFFSSACYFFSSWRGTENNWEDRWYVRSSVTRVLLFLWDIVIEYGIQCMDACGEWLIHANAVFDHLCNPCAIKVYAFCWML